MLDDEKAPRRREFTWEARGALYEFFEEKYGIMRTAVDEEIERVKRDFKLRNNQPIEPRELWQKVGNNLLSECE